MPDLEHLVTHSLLNSWMYAMSDMSESDRDTYSEFLATLRREPIEMTEAMRNGIEFERCIESCLREELPDFHPWYEACMKCADEVRGSQFQVVTSDTIFVDHIRVFLYGRLDCLKGGTIIDTKFSKRYHRGKYFASTQHPVYARLVPEAKRFVYLISDGAHVYHEEYRRDETADIEPIISDFFLWLKAMGLWEMYEYYWGKEVGA